MTKEFAINNILNAVDNISKIEIKKVKVIETKNDSTLFFLHLGNITYCI